MTTKLQATRQRMTNIITRVTAETLNAKHPPKVRKEMRQMVEEFKTLDADIFDTIKTDEEFEPHRENIEGALLAAEQGLAKLRN